MPPSTHDRHYLEKEPTLSRERAPAAISYSILPIHREGFVYLKCRAQPARLYDT